MGASGACTGKVGEQDVAALANPANKGWGRVQAAVPTRGLAAYHQKPEDQQPADQHQRCHRADSPDAASSTVAST